jgi:PIN domain nuclease of toxin-antitoxin system
MNVVYVDTSAVLAVLFGEATASRVQAQLNESDVVLSSNLLEAELRAAFQREKLEFDEAVLGSITWLLPQRALSAEISTVLAAGYLRGADLWHVACALYADDGGGGIGFVTMDARQEAVALRVGLAAPD